MNKNQKEKTVQILIRTKPKDKEKIKSIAVKCKLSVSEYMLQRALGYEPRTIPPDAFYDLYSKLCDICNADELSSPETEKALLDLIDRMHSELLLPRKDESTGSPQSLLCGEKEHPRNGELFDACDKNDEWSVM